MDTFYKILETVMYPLTAYMDWAYDNDVNPIIGVGGMIGVMCGYVAALATPFAIKAHFNGKAMDKICASLDKNPSHVFKVAANHESYTQFQAEAKKSAMNLLNKMGNGWVYSSEDRCSDRHEHYTRNEYTAMTTVIVDKTVMAIPRQVVEFYPNIVGYQVANDNSGVAVPLYSSTKEGYGIRPDGHEIALPAHG